MMMGVSRVYEVYNETLTALGRHQQTRNQAKHSGHAHPPVANSTPVCPAALSVYASRSPPIPRWPHTTAGCSALGLLGLLYRVTCTCVYTCSWCCYWWSSRGMGYGLRQRGGKLCPRGGVLLKFSRISGAYTPATFGQ